MVLRPITYIESPQKIKQSILLVSWDKNIILFFMEKVLREPTVTLFKLLKDQGDHVMDKVGFSKTATQLYYNKTLIRLKWSETTLSARYRGLTFFVKHQLLNMFCLSWLCRIFLQLLSCANLFWMRSQTTCT